jgi:hypothetical protein
MAKVSSVSRLDTKANQQKVVGAQEIDNQHVEILAPSKAPASYLLVPSSTLSIKKFDRHSILHHIWPPPWSLHFSRSFHQRSLLLLFSSILSLD